MRVKTAAALVALALGLAASPALAADLVRPPGTKAPHLLPAPPGAAAAATRAPSTWLVGARADARSRALAARHGARVLTPRGTFVVGRDRARGFVRALRRAGRYRFSEPNRRVVRAQAPPGGDEFGATDWRTFLVPGLQAPATVPLVAVVDTPADPSHPDLVGVAVAGSPAVFDVHGTAVASVIGGRANGLGMVGMVPGAPVLVVGTSLVIADVIRGIAFAAQQGARVINLSLGTPVASYAMLVEIAYATSRNALVVAAAGNEFATPAPNGTNPVMYPAAFPHVMSVASMGPSGASSAFSTANGAVDLAAPGESVLAAVPPGFDDDGVRDGYQRLFGTSLSAPIVSGAAAWLMADGRELSAGQVGTLLRSTAADMEPPGFDNDSGYGLVNVPAALAGAVPGIDPGEVNDDIEWVNGTRFTRPDQLLFRAGQRRVAVAAHVDHWKDPVDVYRIQVRHGARMRVTVRTARNADPDLLVYDQRGRTIYGRRGIIRASDRPAGRPETVSFRNRTRGTRIAYVAVVAPAEGRLDAPYAVTVTRRR